MDFPIELAFLTSAWKSDHLSIIDCIVPMRPQFRVLSTGGWGKLPSQITDKDFEDCHSITVIFLTLPPNWIYTPDFSPKMNFPDKTLQFHNSEVPYCRCVPHLFVPIIYYIIAPEKVTIPPTCLDMASVYSETCMFIQWDWLRHRWYTIVVYTIYGYVYRIRRLSALYIYIYI